MPTRRALLAAPALALPAAAQPRPVTITVPFPPGGSTDVTARLLAERMAGPLGLPVQVENRPGAATVIGADYVARAAPDGHTMLIASGSTLTINPHIIRNIPYRLADFAPVTLISTLPFAIVARPDGPVTLQALMEQARGRSFTYGTNGPSSFNNIAMLLVNDAFGVRMTDITYRGDAQPARDGAAADRRRRPGHPDRRHARAAAGRRHVRRRQHGSRVCPLLAGGERPLGTTAAAAGPVGLVRLRGPISRRGNAACPPGGRHLPQSTARYPRTALPHLLYQSSRRVTHERDSPTRRRRDSPW